MYLYILNLGRISIKIETHFYEYPQTLTFLKRSFDMLIFEEDYAKDMQLFIIIWQYIFFWKVFLGDFNRQTINICFNDMKISNSR